jgi:hypothetical protein
MSGVECGGNSIVFASSTRRFSDEDVISLDGQTELVNLNPKEVGLIFTGLQSASQKSGRAAFQRP